MQRGRIFKFVISFVILLIFITGLTVFNTYKKIYYPNVVIKSSKSKYIYIPTGSRFDDVMDTLYRNNYIIDKGSFEWLAEKKNYKNNIYPGRYSLKNNMSNNDLINLLRSGKQDPVKIVIGKTRTIEQLVGRVYKKIEADSLQIYALLNNEAYLEKYGFTRETILSMFIPNTYKFFWNTSAEQFFERMHKEYENFWNEDRKKKAENIKLTPLQICIIASIVNEETAKPLEYGTIAGVYINRINKGMKLQADPTVKFAIGDFSIRRILHKHLEYKSPYNTYHVEGLPPGPICTPDSKILDAVLNYQRHSYIYFCAKADLSGYHAFAKTLKEHNKNAREYQKALNRLNIK